MVKSRAWLRALAFGVTATLVVACGGTPASSAPGTSGGPATSGGTPTTSPTEAVKTGGTIYLLSRNTEIDQVDPQRAYTGEDLAFFSATIYRSLTAYTLSKDDTEAAKLVPDLATDLGKSDAEAKTWTFTLRDGVTFQDGSAITCADIKYGASRTFATDVISNGPTYAIAYLDIPYEADGQTSKYPGPYKATADQQALFDKAIECSADGKTLTFHLNQPVPDFAYTLTLGWSPVPKAADKGETYGSTTVLPVSSGPYKVESYSTGNGGKMVFVRNTAWKQESDTYRHPYPDKWEIDFGVDSKVIDQRMISPAGPDVTAIQRENIQPENLPTIFSDAKTALPDFEGRAVSSYDIYALYYWINNAKVKNLKIRQAMAVALNRDALRKNAGGVWVGDFADGVIKPNIGPDYAPSGMWTDMFGAAVPDTGDPELAKKLISESGEAAPSLTLDFSSAAGAVSERAAAIVKESLELAGFKITPNPIPSKYYSTVFSDSAHDFGAGGWGADWPNAKTVIPPLFTQKGGWDLSRVDDAAYNKKVDDASHLTDRAAQSTAWQALNKEAMQNAWVIPTFFELQQRLTGGKVGNVYTWGPYGSWAYGDMYVIP
jgi:peptide/nickel transport system substrate-binding protein